jgi:hypothetical protein
MVTMSMLWKTVMFSPASSGTVICAAAGDAPSTDAPRAAVAATAASRRTVRPLIRAPAAERTLDEVLAFRAISPIGRKPSGWFLKITRARRTLRVDR